MLSMNCKLLDLIPLLTVQAAAARKAGSTKAANRLESGPTASHSVHADSPSGAAKRYMVEAQTDLTLETTPGCSFCALVGLPKSATLSAAMLEQIR